MHDANMPEKPKGLVFGKADVRLATGRSRARPVADTDICPKAVDVVIIGGGMVGTSAALTLAERGISVALCEKGAIAGEASGRAMGYIYSHFADPAKAGMLARSQRLWRELDQRTGRDTGYRANGIVAPLDGDEMRGVAEAWLDAMRDAPEFKGQILSAAEARSMLPGMVDPPSALLYTPGDGSAEPVLAAPAIAEAARMKGAIILQNCAVRGIETSGGRISGVVTEKGAITCNSVILAAGAWTPRFAASIDIRFVQSDIYMSMASLQGPRDFDTNFSGAFGVRRQMNGNYSFGMMDLAVPITPGTFSNLRHLLPMMKAFKDISSPGFAPGEFMRALCAPRRWRLDQPSPFEARRVLVPAFRSEMVDAGIAMLRAKIPSFEGAAIVDRWSGVISATLDNMPVISDVPKRPGLFIGSGFSNGFTFGPAAGEALADLATGKPPSFDLHDYRLSRFSDGSSLRFYG